MKLGWRLLRQLPHDLENDPIVERLTRRQGPSWQRVRWLAVAVGVANLASEALIIALSPSPLLWAHLAINQAVIVVGPVVLALMAASLTAAAVAREPFDLVLLTPVTEERLVWGYYLAALYRMRPLIAVLLGLTASQAVWWVLASLGATSLVIPQFAGSLIVLAPAILPTLLWPIGGCGMLFVAVAAGVRTALRWRRHLAGPLLAVPNMLALSVASPAMALVVWWWLLSYGAIAICTASWLPLGISLIGLLITDALLARQLELAAQQLRP